MTHRDHHSRLRNSLQVKGHSPTPQPVDHRPQATLEEMRHPRATRRLRNPPKMEPGPAQPPTTLHRIPRHRTRPTTLRRVRHRPLIHPHHRQPGSRLNRHHPTVPVHDQQRSRRMVSPPQRSPALNPHRQGHLSTEFPFQEPVLIQRDRSHPRARRPVQASRQVRPTPVTRQPNHRPAVDRSQKVLTNLCRVQVDPTGNDPINHRPAREAVVSRPLKGHRGAMPQVPATPLINRAATRLRANRPGSRVSRRAKDRNPEPEASRAVKGAVMNLRQSRIPAINRL